MPKSPLEKLRAIRNLESAWQTIQENGRSSKSDKVRLELEEFAADAQNRLRSLQRKLARNTFKFPPATAVPIPKDKPAKDGGRPKIRPIVLAPVESRIVQRALLNVLLDIDGLKPYIKTEFSFGGIRGNHSRSAQNISEQRKSLSAVPAAIHAVLKAIEQGGRYVACADISSFFTRIRKSKVTAIIASVVKDQEFMDFLGQAIEVELENLAQLKQYADEFPTEDLGVAQGNSLSPLLGNIILADFDREMNDGDCRCIRYIDDFIIVAPTQKAANARLKKAVALLKSLEMELSKAKSSKGGQSIEIGFDFLGIHLSPGIIRPSDKARDKFLEKIDDAFRDGQRALIGRKNGQTVSKTDSLLGTLKRVDGTIDGWAKHYWFCNDGLMLRHLDEKVSEYVKGYLGAYKVARSEISPEHHGEMLGISQLKKISRNPFKYPRLSVSKKKIVAIRPLALATSAEEADDDLPRAVGSQHRLR